MIAPSWPAGRILQLPCQPVRSVPSLQEYMRKYGDPAKVDAVLERVRMELAVYEASPTGELSQLCWNAFRWAMEVVHAAGGVPGRARRWLQLRC